MDNDREHNSVSLESQRQHGGGGGWDVPADTQDPILLGVGFEQKPASPPRRELSLLSAS